MAFPDAHIDTVRRHNAAAPALLQFHDGAGRERVLSRLNSASARDNQNIERALDWVKDLNTGHALIPFVLDPFGNLPCFDYADSRRYEVTFAVMELQKKSRIADSFEALLDGPY